MQPIKLSISILFLLEISLHNWAFSSTLFIAGRRMASSAFNQTDPLDTISTTPGKDYPWSDSFFSLTKLRGDL
jgi:hypothetical protein